MPKGDPCCECNWPVTHIAIYHTKGGKRVDRFCERHARAFQEQVGYQHVTLFLAKDKTEGEQT